MRAMCSCSLPGQRQAIHDLAAFDPPGVLKAQAAVERPGPAAHRLLFRVDPGLGDGVHAGGDAAPPVVAHLKLSQIVRIVPGHRAQPNSHSSSGRGRRPTIGAARRPPQCTAFRVARALA